MNRVYVCIMTQFTTYQTRGTSGIVFNYIFIQNIAYWNIFVYSFVQNSAMLVIIIMLNFHSINKYIYKPKKITMDYE